MVPVLLVATARPDFTRPWRARSNLTTLQLERLTKRQARAMVTTLLGEAVPAGTLEALVARADGVPLYIEELTKAVAPPGAARGKEVAQRAAVLGRELGYPLLAAVAAERGAGLSLLARPWSRVSRRSPRPGR